MTGLFLNIDAITGMTMDDALDSISLPDSVVAALTGEPSGDLGTVIELASAYESGVWDRVEALSASLGVDKNIVSTSTSTPWIGPAAPSPCDTRTVG